MLDIGIALVRFGVVVGIGVEPVAVELGLSGGRQRDPRPHYGYGCFTVVFGGSRAGPPRKDSLCGLRYSSVHHREAVVLSRLFQPVVLRLFLYASPVRQ